MAAGCWQLNLTQVIFWDQDISLCLWFGVLKFWISHRFLSQTKNSYLLKTLQPSLNTQSCNKRPLCSTFRFENVRSPKKPSFIPQINKLLCNFLVRTLQYLKKIFFFCSCKVETTTLKSCSEIHKFCLTALSCPIGSNKRIHIPKRGL